MAIYWNCESSAPHGGCKDLATIFGCAIVLLRRDFWCGWTGPYHGLRCDRSIIIKPFFFQSSLHTKNWPLVSALACTMYIHRVYKYFFPENWLAVAIHHVDSWRLNLGEQTNGETGYRGEGGGEEGHHLVSSPHFLPSFRKQCFSLIFSGPG